MINVQLSREQAIKLEMYLLLSKKYRTEEAKAVEELYLQLCDKTNEHVTEKLKSNSEFWQDLCSTMDDVQEKIQRSLISSSNKIFIKE